MGQSVRTRRDVVRLAFAWPAALILSACTDTRTPSHTVARTVPAPTAATLAPSVTSAKPPATATPVPTMAPTVTPAPSATVVPSPTPPRRTATSTTTTVDFRAINASFPGRAWDFALRPLLFQIDNAPDARPQSGLSSAYAVYETLAEGGITRYTAVFIQQALATIGNLRSARLVDLDLAAEWDGILLHVGASTPVAQRIAASGITQLDLDQVANRSASWRTTDRIAPYNLYSSMARLRPFLAARGVPLTTTRPRVFPIGSLPAGTASRLGTAFTIPYGPPSTADYRWDAAAGGYRRSTDGRPLIDANTGQQILVTNVVVQFAKEIVTNIIEDAEGSHSLQFVLQGTGKAVLLRDGKRLDVTWRRDSPEQFTTYALADGAPATFAAGNVWISFVPDTMQLG